MLAIGGGMSRRNAAEIWSREEREREESGVLQTVMDNLSSSLGVGASKGVGKRGKEGEGEREEEEEKEGDEEPPLVSSKIAAQRGIGESESGSRKERNAAVERKRHEEEEEREEKEKKNNNNKKNKKNKNTDRLSHLRTTTGSSWSLVSILSKLRIRGPDDLFREMDFNGDGLISTDELYKWISRRAGVDLWESELN